MSRLLKDEHVRQLLPMDDALAALDASFRDVARGQAVNVSRHRGALGGSTINAMGAISSALDTMGMKVYPIVRSDVTVGSSFQMLVYRLSTGALIGVLEVESLSQIRTGAASGVATRALARPDSRVMTIFGAGWQARAQLDAIAAVLPGLERVNVIGRSPERVQRFCAEMGKRHGFAIVAAADAKRAVEEADVVTTITGSATPVFDGRWLAPGTHVNAAGSNFASKQELDAVAVSRAQRIVADDVEVARIECGDLVALGADFDWSRVRSLAEVLAGSAPGRTSRDEITLFESQGIGLEDLAVASRVLERAEREGVGIEIPLV